MKSNESLKTSLPPVTIPEKKNQPIPGSKLIGKKGDLDIYLYPKITFSDSEKIKAVIFMVVGQTGCGR